MWRKYSLYSLILLYVGCSLPSWLYVILLTLWYDRRDIFFSPSAQVDDL
jgi:hypothetical protein